MRMVFTRAPEDVFYPARDRLVAEFGRWAGRRRASADPFVVEVMVEYRWSEGDGLLGRWQPEDLRLLLCEWFPRAVTMRADEWATVLPTVRGFIDFLYERGLADARGADPEVLHAALDALVDEFDRAMADPARYGPAKFWSLRMLDTGVDPGDPTAAQRFIDDVRAGRVEVDEATLAQVMAGHLERLDAEPPPPLPVVALLPDDELRAAATKSRMLNRLVDFVEWVGDGRTLTATGRLRLADAREVIGILDLADVVDPQIGHRRFKTTSSEELYETSLVLAWARAARIVRIAKGRLLPVKSTRKVLQDPVALSSRAFDAFFGMGEVVCGADWTGSTVRWHFDEVTFGLVMGLYLAQESVPVADLQEIAAGIVAAAELIDVAERDTPWRQASDHDVRRALEALAMFGVVELDTDQAVLTPLGTALMAAHLRGEGVEVPTVESLRDETAEVVIAAAADGSPPVRDALAAVWLEGRPGAAGDLRALAARTDDTAHRKLATEWARMASRHHLRRV
ncbi:hypothetical protein [Cryptosporangium phraense]|uniref:Uncharacterized protein n=1 Tax=Cryptosporangium phraense TaxID=2593070 RepID=A0A545AGI7_9ACTN|nr:hypothetical protein [Cryptosporangium phraense]TQS40390.1 hypothetical protein FL583_35250 [Cryptosporangium phraense]